MSALAVGLVLTILGVSILLAATCVALIAAADRLGRTPKKGPSDD